MTRWKVMGGQETGGLLCRAGQGLKSSELADRLTTGSIVEELELAGKRLNFKLLEGSGPPTGWISIEIKGKELMVPISDPEPAAEEDVPELVSLDTPPDLDLGPATPPAERPFGLVIYGATGFTGQLAVQHLDALLAKSGAPKHTWAIAGRNEEKLKRLKSACKTDVAIIVVQSEEEVHDMVGKCRVIISCVGPHARHGEPVIRACVAFGTHYTDTAGEGWWIKRMIARYDAEARKRGVTLVSMCGIQAAVPDIGVHMLASQLGPLNQVRAYVISFAFTTGGTDYNGRYTMQTMEKYPEIYADVIDPFVIGGTRLGGVRSVDKDCTEAVKDEFYDNIWLGGLGCASVDLRCVRRSCHLFEEGRTGRELRYGDDLTLTWGDVCLNKPAAQRCCDQYRPLPDASAASVALKAMKAGVENGFTPPRGQGTSKEVRENNWTQYFIVAEGENGEWANCHCRCGENYEVTGMTAVVGALVLLEEEEKVKPSEFGGIVTPAFAFADTSFTWRIMQSRWALQPTGAMLKWKVRDGKPEKEEILKAFKEKTQEYTVLTQKAMQSGTKLFALPDYVK